MTTLLIILHITAGFALILIVLLQTGKGATMGASFGGSSQTVFGSQGAGSFLSKLTTGIAVLFMITSLSLAIVSSKKTTASIVLGADPETEAPAHSEAPPQTEADPQTEVPALPETDSQGEK